MTNKLRLVTVLFASAFLLLISACGKSHYYIGHSDIEDECWSSKDTLSFEVPGDLFDDAPRTRMLTANVRFTDAYKYRKISLGVKVYKKVQVNIDKNKKKEKSVLVKTDTLHFELYDEKGQINGSGSTFIESKDESFEFELEPYVPHTIKVFHLMRLDPLDGISNVVVRIDK